MIDHLVLAILSVLHDGVRTAAGWAWVNFLALQKFLLLLRHVHLAGGFAPAPPTDQICKLPPKVVMTAQATRGAISFCPPRERASALYAVSPRRPGCPYMYLRQINRTKFSYRSITVQVKQECIYMVATTDPILCSVFARCSPAPRAYSCVLGRAYVIYEPSKQSRDL